MKRDSALKLANEPKINDLYLEALKELNASVTVLEWATHFSIKYPAHLERAERQAAGQKNETTGLREIAARISSQTSRGTFGARIEVDKTESPRRVRWLDEQAARQHELEDEEEDLQPLQRTQIIKGQRDRFTAHEQYRAAEFRDIILQLNGYFGTDFSLDHANALLNKTKSGTHHPNNFQILLKSHNGRKNSNNWARFTLEDQIEYISSYLEFQKKVLLKLDLTFDEKILTSLIGRLKAVY